MSVLTDSEFVILDIETTGLSASGGDRIIEIAALKIKDLKPTAEFHSLIDPRREISYGAYLVNGITPGMLKGAPFMEDVLPRFLGFIKDSYLVGHNISFDLGFLDHELALMQKGLIHNKAIDTLRMSRGLLPGLGSYSLTSVAYALGVEYKQEHRAMSDVLMTFNVFSRLIFMADEKSISSTEALLKLFGYSRNKDIKADQRHVMLIEEAIRRNRPLNLSYFSGHRAMVTSRKINPKELIQKRGRPVLVAYCHLRGEEREFHVDRILQIKNLPL